MKKHLLFLLIAVFTACSTTETKKQKMTSPGHDDMKEMNHLAKDEIAAGWQLLFDGTSTRGWRGFKREGFPEYGWQVKDGMLFVEYSGKGEEGNGGDIVTAEKFGNFELKLDWKISPGGNSGVMFRVTESEKYQETWNTAPEIQILDDFGFEKYNKGYVINIKQMSGANYDMHAPLFYYTKPVGEWNQLYLKVLGSHVEQWLNGNKIVEYELWSPEWKELVKKSKFSVYPDYGLATTGHIALQDHGCAAWFRNIKIRKIQ